MNKRYSGILYFILCFICSASIAYGQSAIDNFATDINTILRLAKNDFIPALQSNALLAHDMGPAQIGTPTTKIPKFSFALSGGMSFAPYVFDYLDKNTTTQFRNAALFEETIQKSKVRDIALFDLRKGIGVALPSTRAVLGVGLPYGIEALLQFNMTPHALLRATFSSSNIFYIGSSVRKSLLTEFPDAPNVSIGLGYTYSHFDIIYSLDKLDVLFGQQQDNMRKLKGDFQFGVFTHSIGYDIRVSEDIAFLTPFMGIGVYRQWTHYSAQTKNLSSVSDNSPPVRAKNDPQISQTIENVHTVIRTGIDMRFLKNKLNYFLYLSYVPRHIVSGIVTGFRFIL